MNEATTEIGPADTAPFVSILISYAILSLAGIFFILLMPISFPGKAVAFALACVVFFAFIHSSDTGLLTLVLLLLNGSWLAVGSIGLPVYYSSLWILAAIAAFSIKILLRKESFNWSRSNLWFLLFGLLAIVSWGASGWRYLTIEPIPGAGHLNQAVNRFGASSDWAFYSGGISAVNYFSWGGMLLLAGQIKDKAELCDRLRKILLLSFFLNALAAAVQVFLVPGAFSILDWHPRRATGLMTDGNALGVVSGLLVVTTPFWGGRRWFSRGASLLTFFLMIITGILSGSRTSLLMIAIAIVVFLVIIISKSIRAGKWKKAVAVVLLCVFGIIAVLGIIQLLTGVKEIRRFPTVRRLISSAQRTFVGEGLDEVMNHRISMWEVAAWTSVTHPVSGVGAGTFVVEAPNIAAELNAPLRVLDNALNLFLQVSSELGLPALVFLILGFSSIAVSCLRRTDRSIISKTSAANVYIFLMPLMLCFLLGFFMYFAEFVAVSMLIAGLLCRNTPGDAITTSPRNSRRAWIIIPLLLIGFVVYFTCSALTGTAMHPSKTWERARWRIDAGFYPEELGPPRFRWTGPLAVRTVDPGEPILHLRWRMERLPGRDHTPFVEIYFCEKPFATISFWDSEWKDSFLWLGYRGDKREKLALIANGSFIPADFFGGGDTRELGVAVQEWQLLSHLPEESFGFWEWEKADGLEFQWSKKEGYRRLEGNGRTAVFLLRAGQRGIAKNPLEVKCSVNSAPCETIVLRNNNWTRVELPIPFFRQRGKAERLEMSSQARGGFIHFVISRTWVPADDGDSEDYRELGVAVSESK